MSQNGSYYSNPVWDQVQRDRIAAQSRIVTGDWWTGEQIEKHVGETGQKKWHHSFGGYKLLHNY